MKRDEVPSTGTTEATTPSKPQDMPDTPPQAQRPLGLRRAATTAASGISRPRMRADLRFVHEGPGPEDGQRLPGLLRIIDLRNDRKFDFTAQEHFLCREADGKTSPDDLQQRLQALTDSPLTPVQVQKFFRRLNILGLLEPEDIPAAPATPRLRPRAAQGPLAGSDATAVVGGSAEPGSEGPTSKLMLVRPEAAGATDNPPATDTSETETSAPVAPASSVAETAKPEPTTMPVPARADPAATGRRFAQRPVQSKPSPGRFSPADTDPPDDWDDVLDPFGSDADDLDENSAPGRFGGRMRPGMGGMGGGFGGGMGGGIGGGMGGMGGGMMGMGGGMMGMRGRQMPEPKERERGPTQFPLFNPDLLFRALYFTLWPLKFFFWTMFPITAFAGLTMMQKMPELSADLVSMIGSTNLIVHLLTFLIVVSLGSRIAQGVAITAHGGRVKSLGINLLLGFSPRIYIDDRAIDQLDRRGQMWAHGAPLLFRLGLFAFGLLIWAFTRESGGSVPMIALTLSKLGLFMFLITALPLLPADGMRFMGAALGEPKIMARSLMAARGLFLKGQLPPMIRREEAWPLALFAVALIVTTLMIALTATIYVLMALQESMGGLGVSLFLGIMAVATLWFMAMFRFNRRKLQSQGFAGMGAVGGGAMAGGAMGARMAGGATARPLRFPDQAPQPDDTDRPPGRAGQAGTAAPGRAVPKSDVERLPNRARVVWSLILCALLVAAFLPYRYEAGGSVEILPAARGTAVARTDGEIVEVFVAQGDRVTRGTPLVRLSDWEQLSEIAISEAQLDKARATLAKLEVGAQPEEIDLARAKLARSEAMAAFRLAELERARSLVASETVSAVAVEKAEADYATAVADVEADSAALALTLAGATKEELEIARSDVDRLERELAYDRDELQRTRIVAPMDGVVVTGDLNLRVGDYLRTGDAFLEIEQTDTVTATIMVPEADIGFIHPGQTVRLRAESQSDIEVAGEIRQVAPVAEDAGFGRIVRATAVFPNEDGLLRSSMTGWAKIEGGDMLAWEAYLRTIVRFIKIDVWSWIP